MITYKGQKTVIGKRFIYENEILKYTGKIYGDSYGFINNNGIEYILLESDLDKLKDYDTDKEDLKALLINYTEQELNLINDILVGKSNNIEALNELYKKEIAELTPLNKYSISKSSQEDISLEAQKSYLTDLNRNISENNITAIIVSLQSFIDSNLKGDE